MTLSINIAGNTQAFNIGESRSAKIAIQSYERYKTEHKYEDLKNCFAYLSFTVTETPQHKVSACVATHKLALSTLDFETNIYKKFFIANSASSIIARANLNKAMLQTKALWDSKMVEYGEMIANTPMDVQAALDAGLAFLNLKSKD